MSTVWGFFFSNGEYKIRRVESVTKTEIFNRQIFKPYYYLNPPGLIISLWLNDKSKSEMGTLLIDANKEMSKYNN